MKAFEHLTENIARAFRKRSLLAIIVVIVSVFYMLACMNFLISVTKYAFASHWISIEEMEADAGTWVTGDKLVTWTDKDKADYAEAQAYKAGLMAKNDIAQWCYDQGRTTTGKVIRVITIVEAISSILICCYVDIIAAVAAYASAIRECKHIGSRRVKRTAHNPRKKHT